MYAFAFAFAFARLTRLRAPSPPCLPPARTLRAPQTECRRCLTQRRSGARARWRSTVKRTSAGNRRSEPASWLLLYRTGIDDAASTHRRLQLAVQDRDYSTTTICVFVWLRMHARTTRSLWRQIDCGVVALRICVFVRAKTSNTALMCKCALRTYEITIIAGRSPAAAWQPWQQHNI